MAVLLSKFKKIFITLSVAVLILSSCALAVESNFSDSFFNIMKKQQKKEITPKMAAAREELNKRKIPLSIDSFVKYVKKNDVEVLQIFTDAGFDVNTDFYTDYPIYYATKHNCYEAAKFLLKHNANPNLGFNPPRVNIYDFMSGNTILYTSLKLKQYEIAQDLIKHGARIDAHSKHYIENKKLQEELKVNKSNF